MQNQISFDSFVIISRIMHAILQCHFYSNANTVNHGTHGTERVEQTEKLNIVSYLVTLLWRQLFSATIGSHMRP